MSQFHIGKNGKLSKCTAKKGNCPLGGAEQHFSSRQEYESFLLDKHKTEKGLFDSHKKYEEQEQTYLYDDIGDKIIPFKENRKNMEKLIIDNDKQAKALFDEYTIEKDDKYYNKIENDSSYRRKIKDQLEEAKKKIDYLENELYKIRIKEKNGEIENYQTDERYKYNKTLSRFMEEKAIGLSIDAEVIKTIELFEKIDKNIGNIDLSNSNNIAKLEKESTNSNHIEDLVRKQKDYIGSLAGRTIILSTYFKEVDDLNEKNSQFQKNVIKKYSEESKKKRKDVLQNYAYLLSYKNKKENS